MTSSSGADGGGLKGGGIIAEITSPSTAEAVWLPPAQDVPLVTDTEFAFYLHLEVADRPGVLARVAEILGMQGVSIKSVVQKGLGDEARLVMVMHPVLESKFRAAVQMLSGLDFVREPPRVIRVIEETF